MPGDQVLQRHAIQELHGDEHAAVFFADVINGADVGMVQRRSGLRLAPEAFQRLRVLRDVVGQELEGDETVQARVLGLVDHAHAAAAELSEDAVVRNRRVDHAEVTRIG